MPPWPTVPAVFERNTHDEQVDDQGDRCHTRGAARRARCCDQSCDDASGASRICGQGNRLPDHWRTVGQGGARRWRQHDGPQRCAARDPRAAVRTVLTGRGRDWTDRLCVVEPCPGRGRSRTRGDGRQGNRRPRGLWRRRNLVCRAGCGGGTTGNRVGQRRQSVQTPRPKTGQPASSHFPSVRSWWCSWA